MTRIDVILVPIDGSDAAERALARAIELAQKFAVPPKIELINVQRPVRGDVTMFVGQRQVEDYHRDEGMKALTRARAQLDASGLPGNFHIGLGEPAEVILQYEQQTGCTLICMSTRGAGAVGSLMLGSVAQRVVKDTRVPVMLVK